MNFKVKPLEFYSRITDGEPPVHRRGVSIMGRLPGRYLTDESRLGTDAPVQTLASELAELYLVVLQFLMVNEVRRLH